MSFRGYRDFPDEETEIIQYSENRPEIRVLSLEKDDTRVSFFSHYSRGAWTLTGAVLSVGPTTFQRARDDIPMCMD